MRILLLVVFVSLLLIVIPMPGSQKQVYLCQKRCTGNHNTCLKAANGDEAKKEACDRTYDKCMYLCDPKIRVNNKNIN